MFPAHWSFLDHVQFIDETKGILHAASVLDFSHFSLWLFLRTPIFLLILPILPLLLLFSRSVMSYSWWPHGLQHARLPCPSLSPGNCSNSCPLSQWCHPIISSSVIPFSSCPQSFPASELFLWVSFSNQVDKHWSFGFSINSSNELSGLISFLDWLVWSPCCPRDSILWISFICMFLNLTLESVYLWIYFNPYYI